MSAARSRPLVEILLLRRLPEPCCSALARRAGAGELGVEPEIRLLNVSDPEAAERLHFLGSPTVRVGGRDVEPGAEERSDYVVSCRVYHTGNGFAGHPEEGWVRNALLREAAQA